MKKLGIIGDTGRMGLSIKSLLPQQNLFYLGRCYNTTSLPQTQLKDIFYDNDVIVDVSSSCLISDILHAGLLCPKPLLLCSTGWEAQNYREKLSQLSQKVPVIIAPNTSLGACVQKYVAKILSTLFDENYDIDIIEKHHRYKADAPSGTAKALIAEILQKKTDFSLYQLEQGPRKGKQIGVCALRSGLILGEHELIFTSEEEMVSVKHTVFDRRLFAKGIMKILFWLHKQQTLPGIYSMENVLFDADNKQAS